MNELPLGRSAIASITSTEITLDLDGIHEYRDREHQQELVRVFDDAALTSSGKTLRFRLRKDVGSG